MFQNVGILIFFSKPHISTEIQSFISVQIKRLLYMSHRFNICFSNFQALKKSLFKPAAFFKGILLPLCEVSTFYIDALWYDFYRPPTKLPEGNIFI